MTQVTVEPAIIPFGAAPPRFTIGAGGGGGGVVVTLTVWLVLAVQLFASVTVTEYVVFTEGETVMKAVVEPLLHLYVLPPVAVKVVLVPLQILVVPVMLATGKGLTVTT